MSERITVFDIEVLNGDPASVCSIGIVELLDRQIVNTYYSLIRPKNLSFDVYRYNVHHIRIQDLKKAPSFKEVWQEIAVYFDHRLVVSHDVQGDMAALRAAMKRNKIAYPSLQMSCTNVLAHLLEPQLEKYSVTDLCQYYGIPMAQAHHALADAQACANILIKLLEKAHMPSLTALHEVYHIAFGEMHANYYRNIISPEHAASVSPQKHALTNLSIAFTGNLLTSKEDLHRQLDQVKAYYNREVNSHTSYLVIGSLGYRKVRYGKENRKVLKAIALQKEGQDLQIIHEKEYLQLLKK